MHIRARRGRGMIVVHENQGQYQYFYILFLRLYGDNRDMNIDFYLKDIAFFDGACYSCSAHCTNGELNCTQDFDFIIEKVNNMRRKWFLLNLQDDYFI